MSEHTGSGFDRSEPRTLLIAVFGIATVVVLIAVILGLQWYVDRVREQQVFVRVLEPVSEDLRNLRAREDTDLHSYRYIDREKGTVRIPIERAMELYIGEANAGK